MILSKPSKDLDLGPSLHNNGKNKSGMFMLRIHWMLSTILETSSESAWSDVFWYVKVWILWKLIQYAVHWDKTQILKKFSSETINGTKKPSFFFRGRQLITVVLLICDSYISWSTRFKFIFLFSKMHELFDFKTS